MPRPMYESQEDLQNEAEEMMEFCKAFDKDFMKLPISYKLDFAILKPNSKEICGFAEVKCRNFTWGDYPDVMLSLSKVIKARNTKAMTNIPSFFLVGCRSGVYWLDLYKQKGKLNFGGRTSKVRDPADIEPVVHFPLDCFRKL